MAPSGPRRPGREAPREATREKRRVRVVQPVEWWSGAPAGTDGSRAGGQSLEQSLLPRYPCSACHINLVTPKSRLVKSTIRRSKLGGGCGSSPKRPPGQARTARHTAWGRPAPPRNDYASPNKSMGNQTWNHRPSNMDKSTGIKHGIVDLCAKSLHERRPGTLTHGPQWRVTRWQGPPGWPT